MLRYLYLKIYCSQPTQHPHLNNIIVFNMMTISENFVIRLLAGRHSFYELRILCMFFFKTFGFYVYNKYNNMHFHITLNRLPEHSIENCEYCLFYLMDYVLLQSRYALIKLNWILVYVMVCSTCYRCYHYQCNHYLYKTDYPLGKNGNKISANG